MTRACGVEDVPVGEGRAVTIAGRRIALFRTRGGWYALDDACPHMGGPLSDGIVSDEVVICPLHERRYELASGASAAGECAVAAHRVSVRDDEVHVSLGA
jgi:nitrite reductase (NADH) small subunit